MHKENIFISNTSAFLILVVGFALNPLFDLISSIQPGLNRLTLLSRGLFVMAAFGIYFTYIFHRISVTLVFCVLSWTVLCSSYWYYALQLSENDFLETFLVIIKVFCFIPFCFMIEQLSNKQLKVLRLVIVASLGAYVLSINFGVLFSFDSFQSYPGDVRWGYKGIIYAQNEASALIMVALLFFGLHILIKRNLFVTWVLYIFTSFAALCLGTKSALFLPFFVLGFVIAARIGYLKSLPLVGVTFLVGSSALVMAIVAFDSVFNVFFRYLNYFLSQLSGYAQGDILTALLSGRDNKLAFAFSEYISGTPYFLLFGGYPIGQYMVEIDFFDLFFLLGAPGFLFYGFVLAKKFSTQQDEILQRYYFMAFFLTLLLANTSGHLFTSALVLPYLAFFCAVRNRLAGLEDENVN